MTTPQLSRAPRIPSFMISTSPLLATSPNETEIDAFVALLTKRIAAPLPSLSFAPRPYSQDDEPAPPLPQRQASSSSHESVRPDGSAPQSRSPHPPTPALVFDRTTAPAPVATAQPIAVAACSKEIIALLSLLDRVDANMAAEFERVELNVREARALVVTCRGERQERMREARRRRERERRETKEVDDDFWLGVY